jgi:hypothetical protein
MFVKVGGPSKASHEDDIDGPCLDDEVEQAPDLEFLLPSCLTFAGLQHIINNLCEDAHKGLKQWESMYKDLKLIEAFLRVPERRSRFVWTCLRGGPHQRFENKFSKFKASLYEARWHEVGFTKCRAMSVLNI